METQCSVCRHERRGEVESALAGKTPLREIAHQFGVGKDAVRRHRLHMGPLNRHAAPHDAAGRLPDDRAPCEGRGHQDENRQPHAVRHRHH